MDILTAGSFTAKDVSDILLMITESPENFGFTQEQLTTNEEKGKVRVLTPSKPENAQSSEN